jgi:phospholipid/cholesterol/gamma-HCH transport system permease protein
VISTLAEIDARLRELAPGTVRRADIDLSAIEALDSTGAWILHRTAKQLRAGGLTAEFAGVRPAHGEMLELIGRDDVDQTLERDEMAPALAMVGRVGRAGCA